MIEALKKYIEKIRNYDFLQGDCMSCSDNEAFPPVPMPFLKLAFGSFNVFMDYFKQFIILGAGCAVILSALAFTFGFSYVCGLIGGLETAVFCSGSQPLYLLYLLIKIFILSAFAVLWCRVAFYDEKIGLKEAFSFGKRDVKFAFTMILLLLLNFIPMVSFYLLSIRVPNPDWRIEITYFAIVSVGFLVPFAVLRFYPVLGFIAGGESVPALKEIWLKSRGNTLKILLSLFLIFILLLLVLNNFYGNVNIGAEGSLVFSALSSEFFYNLFFLVILVLWVNHCCLQKKYLFDTPEEKK